ncbi:Uncharacterized protein LTLLF_191380 [Microtus ochrogaster]|uniref:Uncharacterized protein n=1 Tax=Microtus ochrogaster TaxID=79684 RepID=A0A8J6G2U7_MICOH|nr:Uncharacterized protein LTLLF_191380 [Microtus ochrogaster]
MLSTPRGAAGVCPPQQVPGAMATAGISQPGGRKQPQPGFGLRSPNCSRPRGSKDGREGTPRLGLRSLGAPGIHSVPGAVCVRSPRSGCKQGGGSSAQRCLLQGPRWRRAEQRSAAGPLPAAAVSADGANPPSRPRLPEPGGCSGQRRWLESSARPLRSDSSGSADPGARGCPGLSKLGGGGEGARAPLPLGAPAHAAAAVSKCTRTGTCSPTLSPHPQAARVAVRNLGRGVAGGKAGSGSQDPGGKNSPANRQSFSALDFWITMSISF